MRCSCKSVFLSESANARICSGVISEACIELSRLIKPTVACSGDADDMPISSTLGAKRTACARS